ncbi:hypothetical protein BHE74_00035812, partial [Ensete ventricosum]
MGDTAAAAATLHPDEMNAAAAPTSIHRPPFPTLYIGDLHPAVTDAELIYAFTPFGTVASARVCRDRASGTPLGYAYLNFLSFSDVLFLTWILFFSGDGPFATLKNLEITVSGAMLEDLFAVYGTVESCKVAIDGSGRSRGFGFVQMDSEEAAQLAITALNGVILPGSSKKLLVFLFFMFSLVSIVPPSHVTAFFLWNDLVLCVTKFVKKSERQALPEVPRGTNLYIKNLDWDITDDVLRQ